MIELRKTSFFSKEYIAEENGAVVAELSRPTWRERGKITVRGRSLTFSKRGVLKSTFVLLDGNEPVVQVEQPSGVRSRLVFQFDGRDFEIRGEAWYSSTLLVASEGSVVGTVRSRGLCRSGTIVDLPDSLPLEFRVFIGWIAMVRQEEVAGAAVAATAGAGGG